MDSLSIKGKTVVFKILAIPKLVYMALLTVILSQTFNKYKPSPRILRQQRTLPNFRKNEDIAITEPDKGNGVVFLD